MKVTVCFGNIRVKVPCQDEANVRELQEKACARYRRAIGKDPSYGVRILKLESAIDGGILDVDDVISDVVEDKEKLVAVYEEDEAVQRDWDLGSMTSSEDKSTPPHPSFKSRHDPSNGDYRRNYFIPERPDANNSLEVDVDNAALKSSTHVMVLRESDSDVTTPTPYTTKASYVNNISSPRESAKENGTINDPRTVKNSRRGSKPRILNEQNNSKDIEGSIHNISYFRRDVATRQSMGSGLSEPTVDSSFYSPSSHEYNAAPMYGDVVQNNFSNQAGLQKPRVPWFYQDSQEINLEGDGSLEAIQVTSFMDDRTNKFAGLSIQSIDQVTRVGHDHLSVGDVVIAVNEHLLMGLAFDDAEAMLRESLKHPHVQLRILPVEEAEPDTTSHATSSDLQINPDIVLTSSTPPNPTNHIPSSNLHSSNDQNQVSSKAKLPAVAQLSYDNVNRYTKKIGFLVKVQLRKDINGLGFSLTSRDTTVGEPGPIYIKYILPKGAAIKDGRLLAGDRLLEVNGENMLGRTQEEVVTMLRGISIGSEVDITVSRQSDALPRKLKDDPDADRVIVDDQLKEYFLFDIPLNDTGSAGLGISLKGSQSKRTKEDLGVFVKNVLHGGAAWQDGRLQPNDQLIQVNGHSLRNVSNREAIDILRTSMSVEGNVRGMIEMVIARRKPGHDGSRISSEASSDFSDTILDQTQGLSPAIELACDGPAGYKSENEHQGESKISVTSFASSESALTPLVDSPANPDVVVSDEDWTNSDSYEPFSRESTIRQSISEKRRDVVQRYAGEAPKLKKALSGERKESSKSAEQKKLKKRNSNDLPPMKKLDSNSSGKLNARKNSNNSSNYEWRIPQNNFRKSASTESLIATAASANAIPENTLRSHPGRSGSSSSSTDVGPNLGIAKSSSLESLQTALSYLAVKKESPIPKGVRGRVLNDSFRAALDRSYPLANDFATFNHMSTSQGGDGNAVVREEDIRGSTHSSTAPSSDGSSRSLKKRNKLFGLFKKPKPKRPEPENEMHKRDLEARREKDFQKMKEEKERIEAKARELRIKQAVEQNKDKLAKSQNRSPDYERPRPPSVPATSMQWMESNSPSKNRALPAASGRLSVDPFTPHSRSKQYTGVDEPSAGFMGENNFTSPNRGDKHVTSPPKETHPATFSERPSRGSPPPIPSRSRRRTKAENKKHKEAANAYSSLPRQPRQESNANASVTPNSNSGPGQKMSNRDFYHQQKPSHREPDSKVASKPPKSRSPAKPPTGRYHHREPSPEPPPRTVYVLQGTSPQTAVVRRGTLDQRSPQKRASNYRHSIYTDQPTTFNYAPKRPSSLTPEQFYKLSTPPGHPFHSKNVTDDVSSAESTSSEAAERHRRAYYKLMHSPQNDDSFEKIEVSVPYNL